jgi:sulfotransferase famil protein
MLDNRVGPPGPMHTHFRFVIGKKRIVYCRIRKNGCSAMQRFVIETSPFRDGDKSNNFRFIRRYHAVRSQKGLAAADHRILIVRDPVERIRSVFINKFVQRQDCDDILRSYRVVTGADPFGATFEGFVLDYVSKLGAAPLDPHVWPQHWHLCNILYDRVFLLSALQEGMSQIIGMEMAARFFARKVNPSPEVHLDMSCEIRERISAIYADDFRMLARIR